MKNIARSLTGLATQLDMLTTKMRDEANTKRALPKETA